MNIALVTPFYPDARTIDSGLASHFHTLATGLADAGHQVVVLHCRPAYDGENEGQSEEVLNNVVTITCKVKCPALFSRGSVNNWAAIEFSLRIRCMFKLFKELHTIIRRFKLDIIETTSYYASCYLYLFKIQKVPVAVRVSTTYLQILANHYPFQSRFLRIIGQLEIMMMRKSRFLVTHAGDHAAELQRLYGIDARRFTIVPLGVNLPDLEPVAGNEETGMTVLFVGRFEHRKGIDVLLSAIPKVLKTCPNARFELIGADPDGAWQSRFKRDNNDAYADKVNFAGNLDYTATKAAYAGCHVFVAPSRYESFGLIYIEAMSYGKAVIGCRVGGITEIIENEYNGLFADVDSAEDLSKKIIQLLLDPHLRQRLGSNARRTVETKFSITKLAERSREYYNKAILQFKDL